MRMIVSTFLTLDGVMQSPGGVDEDRRDGFEHGGLQLPYFDDAAGSAISDAMAASDGFPLGRRASEIFQALWLSAPDDDELAARMNGLAKFVVSTTLEEPSLQRRDRADCSEARRHRDDPYGRTDPTCQPAKR